MHKNQICYFYGISLSESAFPREIPFYLLMQAFTVGGWKCLCINLLRDGVLVRRKETVWTCNLWVSLLSKRYRSSVSWVSYKAILTNQHPLLFISLAQVQFLVCLLQSQLFKGKIHCQLPTFYMWLNMLGHMLVQPKLPVELT